MNIILYFWLSKYNHRQAGRLRIDVDYESTSIDDALYILDSGKSDGIGLIMIF